MLLLADYVVQTDRVIQTGVGLGSVLAVVCSWERNKSILAGVFSWFYVVYFALTRNPDETKKH